MSLSLVAGAACFWCCVTGASCQLHVPETLLYVHAGCGGHKLSDIEDDQKVWIAEAASHHGYGRVTVESGRSLLWEYVRNKDGRVHDSVRISNSQLDRRRCNAALVGPAAQNQTAASPQSLTLDQQIAAAGENLDDILLQLSGSQQGGHLDGQEEVIATA